MMTQTAPSPEQRRVALSQIEDVKSFAYDIVLAGSPSVIVGRRGGEIVLRGTVRNTSGYNWPTKLSPEIWLEISSQLYINGQKLAAAHQQVSGEVVREGEAFGFELRLPAKTSGTGFCRIDLCYRWSCWFAERGATPFSVATYLAPPFLTELCDFVRAKGDEAIASLSNDLSFAALGRPLLHRLRCDLVQNYLPAGTRVLDLGGAGSGQEGALLAMGYGYAKELTIIDLPPDIRFKAAHERVQSIVHNGTLVSYSYHSMADLTRYPDSSFDLIWSGQTIEHISHADGLAVFREVARILRPGGIFALDTPNRTLTRLAVGDHGFIHAEHKHEYVYEELIDAVTATGLKLEASKGLMEMKRSLSTGFCLVDEIVNGRINDFPEASLVFYAQFRKGDL